jgi:hypothetical protein
MRKQGDQWGVDPEVAHTIPRLPPEGLYGERGLGDRLSIKAPMRKQGDQWGVDPEAARNIPRLPPGGLYGTTIPRLAPGGLYGGESTRGENRGLNQLFLRSQVLPCLYRSARSTSSEKLVGTTELGDRLQCRQPHGLVGVGCENDQIRRGRPLGILAAESLLDIGAGRGVAVGCDDGGVDRGEGCRISPPIGGGTAGPESSHTR